MRERLIEMFCESMSDHLKGRGLDFSKIQPVVDEESGLATFFLYDLSGRIVGYQTYNPEGSKAFDQSKADRNLMKYFTWIGGHKKDKDKKIGVWGLETYDWNSPFLFITEGVFDAAPFHNFGIPAISLLSNDPDRQTRGWLKTLPQKIVVIADNDSADGKDKKNRAGDKLSSAGDITFYPPEPHKDAGDFWEADKPGFENWVANIMKKVS